MTFFWVAQQRIFVLRPRTVLQFFLRRAVFCVRAEEKVKPSVISIRAGGFGVASENYELVFDIAN
jgi:hypothetical protein